jgi:hypothetical protein
MDMEPLAGCAGSPFLFGESASEPTATLTRIQAIRMFHESHPQATTAEIIKALCDKGLMVEERMVEKTIAEC